jgi:hypothetical protein
MVVGTHHRETWMAKPRQDDDGPANARIGRDGLRYYTWKGQEYPSVTSLRKACGVPWPLANWMASQAVEAAVGMSSLLAGMDEDEARSTLRKAATAKRDVAADVGTRVHNAAAAGYLPGDVTPDIARQLAQYRHFLKASGVRIIEAERQVWNLTLGYAGSFDFIGALPDRRVVLCDIKTGKGIYNDHALQLSGYLFAEFVGEDDHEDEKATVWLHRVTDAAILHLSDGPEDGWELVFLDITQEVHDRFEAMARLAHWLIDNPTIDALVNERMTA